MSNHADLMPARHIHRLVVLLPLTRLYIVTTGTSQFIFGFSSPVVHLRIRLLLDLHLYTLNIVTTGTMIIHFNFGFI